MADDRSEGVGTLTPPSQALRDSMGGFDSPARMQSAGTSHPTQSAVVARLRGVRFSYDHAATWALDGIDLDIHAGERICLIGPNGSGKSTLSRIITGLVAPDEGQVILLGSTVFDADGPHPQAYREARRGIGAVFQNPEDQIVTTVVEDDVAFGPENLGLPHTLIGERISKALHAVDMDAYRDDDPTHMSGGQQQRIAIAGTLAMEPRMIVLDEPTAMLDTVARGDVMQILTGLHRNGATVVHVTHLADEIASADRIIRLDQGRVVADIRHADFGGESLSTAVLSQIPEPVSPPAEPKETEKPGEHREPGDAAAASGTTRPLLGPDWRAHTAQPAITVSHVTKRYGHSGAAVLQDLSLSVARGETVAVMGRNGSGKTTLARMLCALSRPDSGSIRVGGIDVLSRSRRSRAALRREVGFIMQRPERQLFASSVAKDIAYGPGNQGLSQQEIHERVDEAMQILHISHLAERSPFSLSGGQQRLVAIAGILACRPNILIMDEPTASLDSQAKNRIYDLIRELKTRGVTMLIITHSPDEARELCDRIVHITPRDIAASGSREGRRPSGAGTGNTADTASTAYIRPTSAVAALDPRIKLLTFLTLMLTAFTVSTPVQLLCTVLMVAAVIVAARMNVGRLAASIHGFLALFVVMGLLNIFFVRTGTVLVTLGPIPITSNGLMVAVLYTGRLAMVVCLGAVLLFTTTPTALTDAMGSLLSPLRRHMHVQELALVMSLALRFLPTLSMETHAIIDAQSARGGGIETGSATQRITALGAVFVPVFAGTLRHADNLSLALDARCYEEGIHRTHWRLMTITARDVVFVVLAGVYIAVLLRLGLS